MTLRERKINSPKDLEGLTIGYPGIPSNKAMLETVLNSEGLTIDDVEILDVGFELVRALISGSVDAIIGAYWTHESIVMELQGFEIDVMRLEEWGVPDYYELVLIVNKDFLVNNDSEVEKMISAFSKGYLHAIDHPEDSINSIIEIAGKEIVEEDVEQKGIKLLIPIWSDSIKFGYQDLNKWEETYNWMKENHFLENDFNIKDFIYTKYSNQ
jgi:putative hydroxymethylpyrimidine transport system substrate-binding protein